MVDAVKPALTIVQRRVLTALRDYVAQRGIAPTVRELATAIGRAPNAVVICLDRLEQAGCIGIIENEHGKRLSRGITIKPAAADIPRAEPDTKTNTETK